MSQSHIKPEYIVIGRVVGTFGWAGEIKVRPETDFPERFNDLREVFLEAPDGSRREYHVEAVRVHPRQIRLKLVEFTNKEDAALLRESLVLIPADQAVPLPAGQYYYHQIIGLAVRTTTGEELGAIEEIIRTPANDVYVTPQTDIPALKEVVKEIDLAQGIMVVDMSSLEEEA